MTADRAARPCQQPVPAGIRLRPDPGLRSLAGGSVLAGGSPLRLLRLGHRAAALAGRWWQGEPVPDRPAARALARRLLDAGLAHPVPAPAPAGPGLDQVTVVIPVYGRPTELARCLAGLAGTARLAIAADPAGAAGPAGAAPPGPARSPAAALPVIVVDDGSPDAAAIAAVAAAAGARCLRRDHRGGPGAARNTGLAAVRTPLVAFVDSDCVPGPGWLDPLLPHFADPAVAAVAPRIVAHEPGRGWLARYEGSRSALDMGAAESIVRPGARVPYVPAAALVARRVAAAAGFAEDMPAGEDVDFVWRLAAAGWHVRYEPRAAVAHQHRERLADWLRRRHDYGTSAAPLELRHPGTVPACAMPGWSALAWLAVAAGQPAAGAALAGTAAALLARRLRPVTGDAWPLAAGLAGRGTLAAGRVLGSAVARTWWPLAVPAAAAVPRLRLPLAAALLVPPVLDWRERRPPMALPGYLAARLLDDLAYSVGVWQGCLVHRTSRPLRPALWWRSRTTGPEEAPCPPVP